MAQDVTVKIIGDSTSLERAFSRSEKAANDFGNTVQGRTGKVTKSLDGLSESFGVVSLSSFGAGAAIAGSVAFMGKAANAASDLNEQVNLTGVTFGDARGEIDKFAKTAAEKLGQSERAAREATSSFGGLLQNLGFTQKAAADSSITLTTLASDLASAFNTAPADAVQAIGAALRGESEPIHRYNVQLDDARLKTRAMAMGLYDGKGALDANARAQAAYAEILQQTTRYQGDFINTSDGMANSQRNVSAQWEDLQAQLGSGLVPVLTDVESIMSKLLKLGGVGGVLDKNLGFLNKLGPKGQLAGLADGFNTLASSEYSAGERAKGFAQTALSIVPVVGGLGGSIFDVKKKTDASAEAMQAARQQSQQWAAAVDYLNAKNRVATSTTSDYQAAVDATRASEEQAAAATRKLADEREKLANATFDVFNSQMDALDAWRSFAENAQKFKTATGNDKADARSAALRDLERFATTNAGINNAPGSQGWWQILISSLQGAAKTMPQLKSDIGQMIAAAQRQSAASLPIAGAELLAGMSPASAGGLLSITVNSLDPRAAGPIVIDAIKSYERTNGTGWRAV